MTPREINLESVNALIEQKYVKNKNLLVQNVAFIIDHSVGSKDGDWICKYQKYSVVAIANFFSDFSAVLIY